MGTTEHTPLLPASSSSPSELSASTSRSQSSVVNFYIKNAFMIHIVVAISLAKLYPPIGTTYVLPKITSSWFAVMFIFGMAGLSLETHELTHAATRFWFNLFVEAYNFCFISIFAFGLCKVLLKGQLIEEGVYNGIIICACMPISINSLLVLTKSSNGDEASAVFHAAFGSFIGVFVSPLLVLAYIGLSANIDLAGVLIKLTIRVIAPVAVGQLLRNFSPTVVTFVDRYKKYFKKTTEWCLVYIVYTTFCKTFDEGIAANIVDFLIMVIIQVFLLSASTMISWLSLRILYREEPKLRVVGVFACTLKSVAIGIPLINAIYEHDPKIGLYSLPLLIWQQSQLLLGSALAPRLANFVEESAYLSSANSNEPKVAPTGHFESPITKNEDTASGKL